MWQGLKPFGREVVERMNELGMIIDVSHASDGVFRDVLRNPTDRRDRRGNVYWRCRCECGNEIEATEYGLVSGNRKSCGCMKKENQDKIVEVTPGDGTCIETGKMKCRSDIRAVFECVSGHGRYL